MASATAHPNHQLISSEDVEGTDVYDLKGTKIGDIDHLMIDKLSGRVTYAVMSFGGFLGVKEKYHPIPWSMLTYDEGEDGYVVNITKEQLQAAPADTLGELTKDDGLTYRDRAFDYYRSPRYWD